MRRRTHTRTQTHAHAHTHKHTEITIVLMTMILFFILNGSFEKSFAALASKDSVVIAWSEKNEGVKQDRGPVSCGLGDRPAKYHFINELKRPIRWCILRRSILRYTRVCK